MMKDSGPDSPLRTSPAPISGGAESGGEPEVVLPRRYFDFKRLEPTNGLWDSVQPLRYAVYCLECKYLDAAKYPQRARDRRVRSALGALRRHQRAGRDGGDAPTGARLAACGFPLEQHAGTCRRNSSALPRDKTAEISRLILARSYRRRANDGLYGQELGDPEKEAQAQAEATYRRSQYPLILFGLFKEMYLESVNMGLEYWVAAMESGLQRMLSKFGLGLRAGRRADELLRRGHPVLRQHPAARAVPDARAGRTCSSSSPPTTPELTSA